LRAGKAVTALAQAPGLEWSPVISVKRDDRSLNPILLRTAFSLPRPSAGGAVYGSVVFPTGDYVLLRLTAARDGDPRKAGEKVREELARTLERELGADDFAHWLDTLRKEADVRIYPETF
jgi:peptidyl-prolyl cis-trans isomerase D